MEDTNNAVTGKPQNLVIMPQEVIEDLSKKMDQILKLLMQNKNSEISEEWLTEKEVQLLIGLKTTSLWALRRRGKLKYSKVGQKIFYSKKSILRLIERNER